MASAQVLPNSAASSRKQEHLQAGRRRLEEFRKKKAAELAKKASSSTSLVEASEVNAIEKQPLDTEHQQVADSNGAGTSIRSSGAVSEPSLVAVNNDDNAVNFSHKRSQGYSNDTHITDILKKDHNSFSLDQSHKYGNLGVAGPLDASWNHVNEGTNGNFANHSGVSGRLLYETASDQDVGLRHPDTTQGFHRSTIQPNYRMDESQLNEHKGFLRDLKSSNFDSFHVYTEKIMPQNSVGSLLHSEPSNSSSTASGTSSFLYEGSARSTANSHEVGLTLNFSNSISSESGQEKLSSFYQGSSSVPSLEAHPFVSTAFGSHASNSSEHVPLYSMATESNSRKSRPSFLDTLNVPRASSGTLFRQDEPEESFTYNSEKSNSTQVSQSSSFQEKLDAEITVAFPKFDRAPSTFDSSFNSGYVTDQPRAIVSDNSLEKKHDFYSNKQNEDFAALEQHIEDLTQEKFSLQRALEAARALAESLASENSSLTDSYNQQRSVVNQLKSEMEMLQEEIKVQLGELEAVRNEYGNVLLECNAADERAKLLASEVIGLEEKALKLRSSELKLERQMENTQAEICSYKKKISSLEKDRLDLHSTIDALQEEKKLLQSKLRKASTSGMPVDVKKNSSYMKSVSTSTEDLDKVPGISSQEIHDDLSVIANDSLSFPLLPANGHSSVNIPPDQFRTIQNINALMSELASEKEELMHALATESSQSSKLKELNNELSRKLELQTQRLELLTAQNMASENPPPRKPDSHDISDNTPYADEGDEVVERVLGWIMKLFPGGPSRRRTSKLM